MEQPDARASPPQSKSGSKGKPKKPRKVMIAVLGVTGAGKSTFVNKALGKDSLAVSHGSKPCTQDPQAIEFRIGDRTIVLIDTPGFDDDKRTDVRILEDIATWMGKKKFHQMLDGLIFLHPVTLTRAGGSELSRTELLENILGKNAYNRVVIATTMWDYLANEDIANERLQSRQAPGGVWHELLSHELTDRLGKPQPLLAAELKQEEGHVARTSAGKTLEKRIRKEIAVIEEQIQKHFDERPPGSYRDDGDAGHRATWKRWNKGQQRLQAQLDAKEAELLDLQSIVVRVFRFFTSIFRAPREIGSSSRSA